jgi:hypothetical protein
MKLPRRNFLHLAAGAAALPAVSGIAGGKRIRRARSRWSCRIPRPARVARVLAEPMRKVLGRPVVIDALLS